MPDALGRWAAGYDTLIAAGGIRTARSPRAAC